MVQASEIEQVLRGSLSISHLVVEDQSSGCGSNYSVLIVSDDFDGRTTIARHQLVNQILKAQIAELHAFSQKTLTNKQYETQKAKGLVK